MRDLLCSSGHHVSELKHLNLTWKNHSRVKDPPEIYKLKQVQQKFIISHSLAYFTLPFLLLAFRIPYLCCEVHFSDES